MGRCRLSRLHRVTPSCQPISAGPLGAQFQDVFRGFHIETIVAHRDPMQTPLEKSFPFHCRFAHLLNLSLDRRLP